jgi:SAM-dependent methyltransferase
MDIAPDGSPVALYLRLPERTEEAEAVHGLLPPGGTVLDLGCGTGRLAEPLARMGHAVTGVDNSPQMLAGLRRAVGVRAEIGTLDLARRFDAVLLMSHFVNDAETADVVRRLRTVRRHMREDGFAVVERHRPGWVATCAPSSREVDGVRYVLGDLVRAGEVLTATIRYEFDGLAAEQRFSVRDVDDRRLAELAAAAWLRVDRPLDADRTLVLLGAAAADPAPPAGGVGAAPVP